MSELAAAEANRTLADLPGPRSFPIVGSALELGPTNAHEVFENWCRRYGDVFTFRIGAHRAIGVATPELARELLQARPDSFRRFGALEPVARELGFLGVFAAEGADWRRQRRLMNPSFHAPHIESFHGSIEEIVERLFGVWAKDADEGTSVDVLRDLMRFTVDVTSIVAFGRDLDTVRRGSQTVQEHLEILFPTIGRRLIAPFPYWRIFPFLDRRVDEALRGVRTLILDLVADARRQIREGTSSTSRTTLLASMIAASDDEAAEQPFSDDEVFANVVTLLLAGEDTTAITIAWMLYYLALHPEVAARARAEVDSVVAGSVPTVQEAKELHYIEAIALEALRLRPPGPQLMLEATHDLVVAGVAVPKGVSVMVMLRLIQMNPKVFGDPERFRPERFLPDAPADTKPHTPRLMLAFGAGPRVCPGRGLALLECAMLVGSFVKRFDVSLACKESDVTEITTFTTQPRGIKLRFSPRTR